MSSSRVTSSRAHDRRVSLRAAAVVAGVLLVFGGSNAAYAVWTSTASTSTAAKAATVAVTQSATNLSQVFSTGAPLVVGAIAVTNSSTVSASYSVLATPDKPADLAKYVTAWRWSAVAPASCGASIPSEAVSYGWEPLAGTLGASGTVIHCIGVQATSMGLADTAVNKVSVGFVSAVTAGSWSASSGTHKAEFTTALFAPAPANNYSITNGDVCVSIGGNGNGTPLTLTTIGNCNENPQRWTFSRIGATDTYRIFSLVQPDRIWGLSGTTVQSVNGNSAMNDSTAQWRIQGRPAGGYQLVNVSTGTCATRVGQGVQVMACTSANANQTFGLSGV